MLHTSRRLELVVLADQQVYGQIYPDLALVSRHLNTVSTAQDLMWQLWEHAADVILLAPDARQTVVTSLCAQVRQYFQTPILIVERGATEEQRIAWLDAGADDVLGVRDATPAELSARCNALLRRVQRQHQRDRGALRMHALGMELDIAGRRLYLPSGQPLDLNLGLTRFLAIFFIYGETIVSAETLGLHMFGNSASGHQRRLQSLRQMLSARTAGVEGPVPSVRIVRGSGYRFMLIAPGASDSGIASPVDTQT